MRSKSVKGSIVLLLSCLSIISQGWGLSLGGGTRAQALDCPAPALNRLVRHQVQPGETLESIADRYGLIPATLMGLNPIARSGPVSVGSELLIPPYNGIQVEVATPTSWKDLASSYGVRPDVLFEANGCQATVPKTAFVPGVNWSPLPGETGSLNAPPWMPAGGAVYDPNFRQGLEGYPLPAPAEILMGYGWKLSPQTQQVFFHPGIALAAKPGTSVLAVAPGIVAFAGDQGDYGQLVVINHRNGKQSRYGHLSRIVVSVGDEVETGQVIGQAGTTGKPSSPQPHLHFEIRTNSQLGWVADDPSLYAQPPNQQK